MTEFPSLPLLVYHDKPAAWAPKNSRIWSTLAQVSLPHALFCKAFSGKTGSDGRVVDANAGRRGTDEARVSTDGERVGTGGAFVGTNVERVSTNGPPVGTNAERVGTHRPRVGIHAAAAVTRGKDVPASAMLALQPDETKERLSWLTSLVAY